MPARSGPGSRRRARRLPLLSILGSLLILGLSPELLRAQVGLSPRLLSIEIEGNRHFSDSELRDEMRLKQPVWWKPFRDPRYLGPDILASDLRAIQRHYQEAGFSLARVQEAVVTYNEPQDEARILIRLAEGPRIRISDVLLRGVEPNRRSEAYKALDLERGEPVSWTRFGLARANLISRYSDRGHALARGDLTLRYEGDSADVVLDFEPGPLVRVDSIRVEGAAHANRAMILREVTLKEGSLLAGKQVLNSQRRLLETGVFTRARIVPEFSDSLSTEADILVSLEERRNRWVGAGAGYSSSDRLRMVAEWGVRDLTGMGRRLGLTGNLFYSLDPNFRTGGLQFREGLVQLDYLEPWLFHTRTRGLVAPYIRWVQEETFHQRTLGYNVSMRRDFTSTRRAALGLQSKYVRTTEKGVVVPRYTTRFINLDLIQDARNNLFDPSSGHYLQATAEYAGGILGGRNRFDRTSLTGQIYSSPQEGWVLAARVKIGNILPVGLGPIREGAADTLRLSHVPIEERFRVGGGTTIRGYSEGTVGRRNPDGQPIGGLFLLLASLEVRFPLVSLFQGSLFMDLGNVWTDASNVTFGRFSDGFSQRAYDPENVAYSMGLGLRMRTPVGPFRFDYGFKVGSGRAPGDGPGNLHVALGQAF